MHFKRLILIKSILQNAYSLNLIAKYTSGHSTKKSRVTLLIAPKEPTITMIIILCHYHRRRWGIWLWMI